jgi:hypothetical protein
MASLIVNQGLQRIGIQASEATSYNDARNIQVMAVDDATEAFLAADTKMNDGTGFTQEFDAVFDATPTRSAQTISHVMTIPTGSGNFTIRRVSLHDDTAANVTASSLTLVGGIDGQSLTKTSDFTLAITVSITYTSV